MAIKLVEHTHGNHIYMKMVLDNRRIEEVDVYLDRNGKMIYKTSADKGMRLNPEQHEEIRNMIINTFNELY